VTYTNTGPSDAVASVAQLIGDIKRRYAVASTRDRHEIGAMVADLNLAIMRWLAKTGATP
jgi:hypothetical protein